MNRKLFVTSLLGAPVAFGLFGTARAEAEKPRGATCQHGHQCTSECCQDGVCRRKRRCS
jgi:hypothetical protein